jgi:enoyl-CoA hydratase
MAAAAKAAHLLISRLKNGSGMNNILIARLNRPERLNALSPQMGQEIIDFSNDMKRNPGQCTGIIFTGNERAFSTGRDLKLSAKHNEVEAHTYMNLAMDSVRAVLDIPVPTIAAIDGYCLGWGFELGLACDFRVVNENSKLRFPETSLGIIPGACEFFLELFM